MTTSAGGVVATSTGDVVTTSKGGVVTTSKGGVVTADRAAGVDSHASIVVDGTPLSIEYRFVEGPADAPLVVFVHEGLGSVAMWKDFPDRLCAAGGWRGLVYSRPAYGTSTPRPADVRWGPDFMHRQACDVLPAFLAAVGVDAAADPPWLLGHSDGGSIALIHAARFPSQVAGLVVMAPHLDVEQRGVDSIALAREAYLHGDLRAKLARYHADVDSAFWGWNDIWLAPAFRTWNIRALLPDIACPVLAIQGEQDEYGTMAHIDGIADVLPDTELLKLGACGHSPHRDQPEAVIEATVHFVATHATGGGPGLSDAGRPDPSRATGHPINR